MKRLFLITLVAFVGLPFMASAETWRDVPVIDSLCLTRFKSNPDKHTTQCALQCVKGGYGLIDTDGDYLKFDPAGNQKTVAALKATPRIDHLRATVIGEQDGDTINVTSIAIE